mmetsp:Transcript_17730/g.49900  ORF Transcript_17730/g.49900 Transcript_17730/m.49900 type:complete len:225 (+) Transcript_17730:1376-2050(+)
MELYRTVTFRTSSANVGESTNTDAGMRRPSAPPTTRVSSTTSTELRPSSAADFFNDLSTSPSRQFGNLLRISRTKAASTGFKVSSAFDTTCIRELKISPIFERRYSKVGESESIASESSTSRRFPMFCSNAVISMDAIPNSNAVFANTSSNSISSPGNMASISALNAARTISLAAAEDGEASRRGPSDVDGQDDTRTWRTAPLAAYPWRAAYRRPPGGRVRGNS